MPEAKSLPAGASGVGELALTIAHVIGDPVAALVANLDLVVQALSEPTADFASFAATAKEPLRVAQQSAERIRAIVKHLHVIATPREENRPSADVPDGIGAAKAGAASSPRRARVLVVDDEEMIGNVLRRSLREHDVHVLDSSRRALDRVQAGERFDLILCDLMMPDLNGMDLYEEIVRIAPDQAPDIVFITGGAVTRRAREFVATVPNPVMEKPFDFERLRRLIRERVAAHRRSHRTVLVVDDDDGTRTLVVRWLTGAGFECIEQTSGEAAVRCLVAGADQIDAVVLDVMMPGLDGFEVIRALKTQPATAHIPVILLTAHATGESEVARGIDEGAAFYLTKPFSGAVLVAKVRAACERSEAEREVQAKLQFAERHATTDALTGLMNRRAFEVRLVEGTANATRHREPLSLVVLDIDHFKQVNDTFGHAGGDRALLYFARALRRGLRVGDQAFRHGGEEFALLLPKCNADGALRVATRIRADLLARPVSLGERQSVVVRFSAGIATADFENEFRVEDLVARADAALYKAKNEGRDRVELAAP